MDALDPPARSDTESDALAAVPLRAALGFWLRLGCTGFGGPAGQIAQMHEALVERRKWISERRFLHALNYCMLLPGPEAQQLATYLGWLMHRTLGGLLAGALFVLPSLLLMILLAWVYAAWGDTALVAGLFSGIKPAVTALVLQAALRVGTRVLRNALAWALAGTSLLAISVFAVPFPAIVLGAALIGWAAARGFPARAPAGSREEAAAAPFATQPAHTRFRAVRCVQVMLIGLALWALPLVGLMALFGPTGMPTLMAWFFSKAALVTFGGAYAVLPYVVQATVEQFGWLTTPQVIDGLALGETTPGPLIMVLTFFAFVAGWGEAFLGPDRLLAAGVLCACVATWFTFLPSFVFILAGGPLVESTRGRTGFAAPLAAVTAAVVGVILNLAGFFAWHVFWPQGFESAFDLRAFALALASAIALIRYRRSVLEVLAGAAAVGLVLSWVS